MNCTLQKVNCKVLFGVAISLAAAFIFSVQAYAYEMVLIPNFVLDNNYVYVAKGVSPRTASLSSVNISYDSLADLVYYYCNEHGLSTSLVYNSAADAYVGWVNDSAINITGFSYTTLNGLLGNNAGKVYVAQDLNSAGTGDINSPSHWMSFPSISPVISPVSYDALCRIVLDLSAVQQPAEITTYSYGNTTYYVVISDGGRSAGKYYCSLDGRIYAIPVDRADISLTIQVWCYQIKNKLVGLSDYIQNTLDSKLDTLTSVISNGKVLVDNSDVVSAIQSIPAYDDSTLVSAVTTISNQITEQFGEYDSTYSFPNFSSSGQSAANNKTVSGVLPSAFTSINPGTRQLLYSPSGTLILPKRVLYNGGGDCKNVYCTPYIHQTYGLGYRLEFLFRFSRIQNTPRTETVQFPQVSFTDYSGETLTLYGHSGTVRVSPHRDVVSSYLYYFPRWDASGNWLGWSGQNDTFQWTSSTYEPSKRVYLTPPESGTYYIYGTSDAAIPVVYASRFTGFLQSQTDRVVNAVGSIPAPTDYTTQLTAVTGRMDDILAQLQSTSGSATCEHTYSQHMEQEATCILPGLMISTCSKCGDSSSEIVDPLGHDWQCTSHVDAVTDPDTGEETSSAYDIYTCSRCGDTYEDHTGTGAPDEDYSNTTISQLVVKVFSKLGTFAGKLLGSVVHLFDKAVNAVDDLASKFNDYVEQIKGFGENYPIWLSGFWGIIPAELQVALTFAVICMALGVVGKKLFFS